MAQKVTHPRELLLQDLGAMLKAEREIAKALARMQKAANDRELAKRLEKHVAETRGHVENVEKAFKELGARPKAGSAAGVQGLQQEFKESSSAVGREVKDIVTAGVAARVEHYEIAAYETLVAMARALGERSAADLLDRNLKEEKAMLRDGQKVARRLGKEVAKAA